MARQEGEEDSSTGLVINSDRDWTNGLQSATDWVAITLPVISVAVIDEHAFTRECITRSLREFGDSLDVASFAACDDCLQSTRMHDLVLYHLHESVAHPRERVAHHGDDEARLACLRRLLKIAPVIILSGVDGPASIAEAFEAVPVVTFRQPAQPLRWLSRSCALFEPEEHSCPRPACLCRGPSLGVQPLR
jgi:CheY-like chemotaxis protein